METGIIVKDLYKSYGKTEVLHGVSMEAPKGEITGIVGRNGSGKSVLMQCILGMTPITKGSIEIFGKRLGLNTFAPDTGFLINGPGFVGSDSGLSNLRYFASIRGKANKESVCEAMRLVGLDPDNRAAVRKYSTGMRQRLGIAQAIMEDPSILILDEPFNGLDEGGVSDIRALLIDLREKGKTILLSSHYAEDIQLLCQNVYRISAGVMTRDEKIETVSTPASTAQEA